jgi:hypothetical protein
MSTTEQTTVSTDAIPRLPDDEEKNAMKLVTFAKKRKDVFDVSQQLPPGRQDGGDTEGLRFSAWVDLLLRLRQSGLPSEQTDCYLSMVWRANKNLSRAVVITSLA